MLETSGVLKLRAASVAEADELTALCLRAKAVWGYDSEFMEACRAELTITPERIGKSSFQVAEIDSKVAGFARLSFMGGGVAELNALFIEPEFQGQGVGRALFDWAITTCREHNTSKVVIDSDPGAASFYRRMGAADFGQVASGSIPGRMIPRLVFWVAESEVEPSGSGPDQADSQA